MDTLTVNTDQLIHWFNAVRDVNATQRNRVLDAFWSGQLRSKAWLVNSLGSVLHGTTHTHNIYIFGGWIGVLGNMLLNQDVFRVGRVRSIDLDPWCESVADTLNKIHEIDNWRFKARTADMRDYEYEWHENGPITPHIVINTSSEHISQEVYNSWYDRIPVGSLVVVQGNNFFDCSEHIRCCTDLDNFSSINMVNRPLFIDSLQTDMYTRFMAIWTK